MPFTASDFVKARPFVFHLTDRSNLQNIKSSGVLYSASNLFRQSGSPHLLTQKRRDSLSIRIGKRIFHIRDQKPLHAGNITFEGNWQFGDVIAALNDRVFFWPGNGRGPIAYGQRHFLRYQAESPVILRISTADLIAANSGVDPLFCRFNSGSPRCTGGKGSPRGPTTFVPGIDADFTPSKVVELTIVDKASLPTVIEVSDSPHGPWQRI